MRLQPILTPQLELSVDKLPLPRKTPLLKRNNHWVKYEGAQISGSVKYRMVRAKLAAAISKGAIQTDTILTEVSAGSTGVALAFLGEKLGNRVEIHAYESASAEKCKQIRDHGAKLILHPQQRPMADIFSAIQSKMSQGNYWHLNQYQRADHRLAYRDLVVELLYQIQTDKISEPVQFFCPIGTGGLIQGVGTALRNFISSMQIIAVEPLAGVPIDGMRNTEIFYMGEDDSYDRNFADSTVRVDRPLHRARVSGFSLGESASAVWQVQKINCDTQTLSIAPD